MVCRDEGVAHCQLGILNLFILVVLLKKSYSTVVPASLCSLQRRASFETRLVRISSLIEKIVYNLGVPFLCGVS